MLIETFLVYRDEDTNRAGELIYVGRVEHSPSLTIVEFRCQPQGWASKRDNALRKAIAQTSLWAYNETLKDSTAPVPAAAQ